MFICNVKFLTSDILFISEKMTVCSGVICEKGKRVIVVSDRMWTQKYLSVEFEHEEPKIQNINDFCVVATAGNVVAPTELIENAKTEIKKKNIQNIGEIAEIIKKYYAKERNKRIEDEYFVPRGLTIKDFYKSGVQSTIYPNIVTRLDQIIETYDQFQLEILVAGIDDTGGHLYVVFSPGRLESFDRIGYISIGTGSPHVESTFILNGFKREWNLEKSLYVTYEGKKLAQKAPGVGVASDLVVIDENSGITEIKKDTLKQLDSIFLDKTKSKGLEDDEIQRKINDLKIFEEKINADGNRR